MLLRVILPIFICALCSGCAVTYIDDNGHKRVIGFVDMTIEADDNEKLEAGEKTVISNIGLMLVSGPHCGGLSLGYTREEYMTLKNHALVVFPDEAAVQLKDKDNEKDTDR